MIIYLLIFCLLILGTVRWPQKAIGFVFFTFSFEQLLRTQGDTFPIPIRFSQIITLTLFALLLVYYFYRLKVAKPKFLFWVMFFYVSINAISILYAESRVISLRQFVILLLGALSAITYNLWIKDRKQVYKLIKIMWWGAVIHFIFALVQWALFMSFRVEMGYPAGMGEHLKVRVFGWMFEPNWLAVFIVVVYPWFLFALDHGEDLKIRRSYAYWGVGLLLVTIFLNMSRLGWIAIAIQTFIWAISSSLHLQRYLKRALIWSLPVLVFMLFVLILSPEAIKDSFVDRFVDITYIGRGQGAANQRYVNYIQLWDFFLEKPWMGYAVGSWPTLIGSTKANTIPTTTYLYILVEVGVTGFAFLTVGLVYYLIRLFFNSIYAHDGVDKLLFRAAFLSVVGILITGLFVEVKTLFSYFPVFGFYWALTRILISSNKKIQEPLQARQSIA